MSSKANITLKTRIDSQDYIYVGRFLGFIKDDEFNALVSNVDEVPSKLESKATQSLVELARSMDNLPASRLVMTVKTVNDKTVIGKQLFVSPRCDYVSSISKSEVVIELEGNKNELIIEEGDNEK